MSNEKKILMASGALLLFAGLFLLPAIVKNLKPKEAEKEDFLLARGPTVSGPGAPVDQTGRGASAPMPGLQPFGQVPDGAPPEHPPMDSPEAYAELGLMFFQQENYSAAAPYLQKSVEKKPDASVMAALGSALRRIGKTQEALKWLQESLQLEPNGKEALLNLGLLQQYDLADIPAAITTFQKLASLVGPTEMPDLQDNLAYLRKVRDKLASPNTTPDSITSGQPPKNTP